MTEEEIIKIQGKCFAALTKAIQDLLDENKQLKKQLGKKK